MTGTVIDFIRFAADQALAVPALIDLRPYTITLNTLTWSGDRPGLGTLIVTQTPVYNLDGYLDGYVNDVYVNPRFRQVSKREVVLSGGVLNDQDVVIGPLVFPYNDGLGDIGGTDPLVFAPSVTPTIEFYINIQGPNLPEGGANYKKIWDNTQRNVMYRVYLRKTATSIP